MLYSSMTADIISSIHFLPLRWILLGYGGLDLVLNTLRIVVPKDFLARLLPELNGVYSQVGLNRYTDFAIFASALDILAVLSARQGEAHEQRRVAQVRLSVT